MLCTVLRRSLNTHKHPVTYACPPPPLTDLDRIVNGVGEEYRFGKQLVAASGLQVLQSPDGERGSSIVHNVVHAEDHLQHEVGADGYSSGREPRGRGGGNGGRRRRGLKKGNAASIRRRMARVRSRRGSPVERTTRCYGTVSGRILNRGIPYQAFN